MKSNRVIFLSILLISIVFRLAWIQDMEWKWDEKWMFQHAENWAKNNQWPVIGVLSGAGFQNTGFSTWPFILMAKFGLSEIQMAFSISIMNILALLLFYISMVHWKPQWKTGIQWGILLALTHVLGFVFSRKIWAQDLLPFFTAIAFWGWVHRVKIWPIFISAFGFSMATQLHISGFYLLGSFLLASVYYDFKNRKLLFKWILIFGLSFIVFFIPSLPWVYEIISHPTDTVSSFGYWYKFEYLLRILTDTVGINVHYSLGKSIQLFATLPSFLYLICIPILGATLLWLITLYKGLIFLYMNKISKDVRFLLLAYVLFPALFYTLSSIPVRNHYLIIVFPMMQVMLGIFIQSTAPTLNKWLSICQLLISISFMWFVHNQTIIDGDYGVPYSKQSELLRSEIVSERPPGK